MKSLIKFLIEAKSPTPSALKKFKQGSKEVENEYIVGDIYDLSGNNRYKQKDSYYQGDGDGYIIDKNGNVYDVKCSEGNSDAGRIVGGTFSIGVTIYRVGPNKENIGLSGYEAIFSRPSSETFRSLISDIKDGIYLEDYLAYHVRDIDYSTREKDWCQSLIKSGNAEGSRTEKMKKRDAKIAKEESFNQRYCVIKPNVVFECKGGQNLEYTTKFGYDKIIAEIKPSSTKNQNKGGVFSSEKAEIPVKVPENIHNDIVESYKKLAEELISKMFGSADVKGMKFEFGISFEGQEKYGGPLFGWDIKKKQFAILDFEKRKVLDRKYELRLAEIFYSYYKGENFDPSDFTLKFFEDASKIMIKQLGTESAYVAANYKSVAWGNGYWKAEMKMGEAKQKCKEAFAKMKDNATFNRNKTNVSNNRWFISPEVAAQVLGGKSYQNLFVAKQSKADSEQVDIATPEVTNGPDKPKTSSKSASETYGKAYGPAKEKMEKWHKGERKQNLKNCNDGKLRMNYAICKELGYEDECKQIAAEASKRGIVLESKLSLTHFIQAMIIED